MLIGIILILLGLLFLLNNLGIISVLSWHVIWPIVLIVVGLGIIIKKRR